MASLERELTAGPTPLRTGRWSEFTQLSRQIKQAGLLDRRDGYYAAKLILNLGLLAFRRGCANAGGRRARLEGGEWRLGDGVIQARPNGPMERRSPSSVTDVHAGR